jgi:hypothetical protein
LLEVGDDRVKGVARAIQAVGRWARRFLISRRELEASVRTISSEPVELVRIRWRGRTRRVTVRRAFTESRVRHVQEPLDPGLFDPWVESSQSLAARTRLLARCRTCGGEKKVHCLNCQGTAMVPCDACQGSGLTWSPRSRRMVGCRACRRSGRRRCSCRDGWLSCGPCGGKGKVEEWLEIVEEAFDRVTFAGSDVLARALPGCADPEKFDTDSERCSIPRLSSWRGRTVEEAPGELWSLLRLPDLAGIDPREDRLLEVAVQVFRSETTTVAYQLGGVLGSVQVQEWDGRILENDSSRKPFQRRRRRTLQGMLGAALAGAALALWYGGRHPFFLSTPNHWLLWILAVLLGICIVPLILWWVLPADRRSREGTLVASLPALLVVLTQAGLASTGGPSLDHARATAASGQFEEALRESAACFDLGVNAGTAGSFHDQLLLGRAQQVREPRKAWEAATLPFLTENGREQARAHAIEVTVKAGAALQQQGEFAASALVLDAAPVELRRSAPLAGLRRRVYLEEAVPLWKVISSRRVSLDERLAACNDIAPDLQGLAALPAVANDFSFTPEEVEAKCANLREQRLQELERQRIAEAREAERAQRRAEAAREAAQRRWAHAPLLCNDGTPSPTCICGSSSHRGCCSWHGGVAGCSVEYPN